MRKNLNKTFYYLKLVCKAKRLCALVAILWSNVFIFPYSLEVKPSLATTSHGKPMEVEDLPKHLNMIVKTSMKMQNPSKAVLGNQL